jgi:hypothetical protein
MNKFNIGDEVVYFGIVYKICSYDILSNVYLLENQLDSTGAHESELIPYIEQDTKEDTPCSDEKEMTVGLDYKAEYNRLLEEHEELKELHEIALMMIKLGSELI